MGSLGFGRLPISLDGSLEEHGRLLLVAKVGVGAAAGPVAVAHGLHRHVTAVAGVLFAAQALRPGRRSGDRKSVVEGTSGSVRVDSGGRRNINNKIRLLSVRHSR